MKSFSCIERECDEAIAKLKRSRAEVRRLRAAVKRLRGLSCLDKGCICREWLPKYAALKGD